MPIVPIPQRVFDLGTEKLISPFIMRYAFLPSPFKVFTIRIRVPKPVLFYAEILSDLPGSFSVSFLSE